MRTKHLILFLLLVIFISSLFFLNETIKNKLFFNQVSYSELIEKVENEALSANIKIVRLEYSNNGKVEDMSVSSGASGVIIAKEGNRYFAVTANHVLLKMEDIDDTKFVVMGYDALDFADYLSEGGEYRGIREYYQQFPIVSIEHVKDEYDLAIISFITDSEYTILPLADGNAKYGDIVATISNPSGNRNIVTIGKISSKKLKHFGDETGKMQHPMMEHTAKVSEGSSGGALLNDDLEVMGIHIGGNYNLFRQFKSGMAMPNEQIRIIIEELNK